MKYFRGPVVMAIIWVGMAVVMLGCASSKHEEQLLQELANLDKTAIFDRGQQLYEEKEWADARRYFSFVYDTFPNDPLGHKAALRIADTYAVKKDSISQTEARLRYKDFTNRYPNDPDRDYALLMLGKTHTPHRLRADRDLTPIREALGAYQQLVNLYPNSDYHAEAQERMAELLTVMADHEWMVAKFFARNKRWQGAVWRLEYLKENYPDYPHMEEVDTLLASSQGVIDAWKERYERLRKEAVSKKDMAESTATDLTASTTVE